MSASNSAVLPIQTSDRWKEKPHGNPTFFFRKSSFTGNIVLACPQRSHYYRGGGGEILCVRVSCCCTLNGLLRLHSQGYRPLLLTAHVQESSYCCLLHGVNMFFSQFFGDDEYEGQCGLFFFLISNTFYYTVKYKTITKRFYSQMYKI